MAKGQGELTAEEWYSAFCSAHLWVPGIVGKYGVDLPSYDLDWETTRPVQEGVSRANFIEDIFFLKTFDEFVSEKLPQGFSSVLEVGIGLWSYASAMATFFRKYSPEVPIIGIDIDPSRLETARDHVENRNVKGIEIEWGDISKLEGSYDIVVNLCPNLSSAETLLSTQGYVHPTDFFRTVGSRISENGLLVFGLNAPPVSETDIEHILEPNFKDIEVNSSKLYAAHVSDYSIDLLVTARPK